MVLTYLVVATLVVLGLVWLGRRFDANRRSVARYHKAMDVLAEITHEPAAHPKAAQRSHLDDEHKSNPKRAPTSHPNQATPHPENAAASHSRNPASHAEPTILSRAVLPGSPSAFKGGRGNRSLETRATARRSNPGSVVVSGSRARRPDASRQTAPTARFVFDDEALTAPDRRVMRTPVVNGASGASPWMRGWSLVDRFPRPSRGVLGGVAALVAAFVLALALVSLAGSTTPRRPAGHLARATTPTLAAPSRRSPPSTTMPPTASSTTTAPPSAPAPGGGPVLSAISPDVGQPGQTVDIQGTGLMSADGLIVVMFGAQQASTSCPSQQGCVVTVPPPLPGQPAVPVQVKTAAGVSNSLTFRYGAATA